MADILVVDDDDSIVQAFRAFLASEGHDCRVASNVEDAVREVSDRRPDLVISDVRMPGADGLEGLQRMREIAPGLPVIVMTAYGTSQTSIEAMRLGAFDYLSKPLDLDELRTLIRKAAATRKPAARAAAADDFDRYGVVALVGTSPQMVEIYKTIGVLATNDVPPLIVGERGVGKQLIARTIHANSSRKDEPFVAIDGRSLPEPLLEGELQGATTLAERGSLCVAGLDALSPAMQARLAKLLAGRRAGTSAPRVIGTSEAELSDLVRQGAFSRELYDFVGVIILRVPPLRERRADIPELVAHFIRRANDELGRSIAGADSPAMRLLTDHTWPGNVAELELTIKRACILARGDVIAAADLKSSLEDPALPGRQEAETALEGAVRAALRQRLSAGERAPGDSLFHTIVGLVEEGLVREALAITGGNQLRAAELLGVNRATLRKKMNAE
jgi:DNA-binding NtrC family response regulator